jgi:hypothetical protein
MWGFMKEVWWRWKLKELPEEDLKLHIRLPREGPYLKELHLPRSP